MTETSPAAPRPSAAPVRDGADLLRDALAVLQPGFDGTEAPDWLLRTAEAGLMSVGLFGRNVTDDAQVAGLTARLREARPEILVAVDEEGGDVTRLDVRTGSESPGNHALGAVDDPQLTREVARELGTRLARAGISMNWGPCADVNSDPRNPVIGVRSFGADPGRVATQTAAWIDGLQSAGVAACAKHFPGHGDTHVDSHLALPRIGAGAETLRERELAPFRAAVDAGAKAVMSAHLLVPALDPEFPATLSRRILTGLLREELGFTGLVVTDGLEMRALADRWGAPEAAVRALAAGADALCLGGSAVGEKQLLELRDAVAAAVTAGELSRERLAEAAARVRELAAWTREQAAGSGPLQGEGGREAGKAGLTAARRALRVTGPLVALTAAPYVASFTPAAHIAVGEETPWGLAAELRRLLPGTEGGSYGRTGAEDGTAAGTLLAAATGRPLVLAVRDLHRHPWMAALLGSVLEARPDAVVVEMGVPQSEPNGAVYVVTNGAAQVCARAAAEVLTGTR